MKKPERFVQLVNSPKLLTLFSLAFLFIESGLYAIFEKKNFVDSLWWALITATTVGYGDSYPNTTGGRFVAVTLVLGMILFLIPMITASIASKPFCAPAGATGKSAAGVTYTCKTSATDTRNRWRQ
jgi:hypothetical protein